MSDEHIADAGKMVPDGAVTAAELDELPNEFEELANRFPEINPSNYDHDDACALNTWGCEAAGALRDAASLRKQLDEARAGHHLHDALRRQGETIAELMADNAKKDAALREIKNAVYGAQGYNATYAFIYTTACDALTPASQEADHVADAGKMVSASQEAPASPAADMVLVPRDDLQTLIEQADSMAFERSSQDYEQFGRPQYIENAYGWLLAPASPSPGMREAVRHKKRGTTYDVIGEAELQVATRPAAKEGDPLTIYRCHGDGKLWARPTSEFRDGRFEPFET